MAATAATPATILIELNGNGLLDSGLTINGGNSLVQGLVINRFGQAGILLQSDNNRVQGNFIGTDPTGTLARGNQFSGVLLLNGSRDNLVGGTTPAARNLIAGNGQSGIADFDGFDNRVQGNLIGTDASGTATLGNGFNGILAFNSKGIVIGGATPGAGNLISGNNNAAFTGAIQLRQGTTNAVIQGNLIGTDARGTATLGSTLNGVSISDSSANIIGGTAPGEGNVIAGNSGAGINFSTVVASADGNVVQGNFIGTDRGQTLDLGNATGVQFDTNATNNTIGGAASGAGNVIAFNTVGVALNNGRGNQVFGNSIYRNDQLGIDIAPVGVNANDFKDPDAGPNNGQNYPTLSALTQNGSASAVAGNLNSTPNTQFSLDFYANDEADPSGFGEGKTYLGAIAVNTDFRGDAPFAFPFSGVAAGQFITATATNATTSDTSEFSNALLVRFAGALQFAQPNFAVQEGTANATITVTRTGGTEGAVSVNYATSNGTAIAGSDYTSASGTLNFAAGQSSATFTIPITDDSAVENDETVNLTLSNASGGAGLGTPINATLTIVDNDSPQPGNASPVADDQSLTTPKNTPRAIVLSGRDSDTPQASLTYRIVTPPANGTLSGTAPNLTYTPKADFVGPDSFAFVINDGNSDSNLATISLQVLAGNAPPVNAAPVADDLSRTTPKNTALSITLTGRDSDTPPANLTYRIITPPQNGALSGTAPNLIYTPAADFVGPDSFTFVINDGSSDSNLATIFLQVLAGNPPPVEPPVVVPPIAVDDSYVLVYGPLSQAQSPEVTLLTTGVFQIGAPGVLGNDRDPQNRNLSVRLASNPQHGRIQLRTDGSFFYLPSSGFAGVDEFAYKLDNGQSTTTAKVRLTVIDRLAPELRFDTPRDGAMLQALSAIKGRVRDRNSGLKSLTLVWRRFDGKFWDGSAWVTSLTELPLQVDGINWVYEGDLPTPGDNAETDLLKGVYQLRASATDNSGNISRVLNRITIGSSAPAS